MKTFQFRMTSEFEEIIDKIISSMLPHNAFDIVAAKGVAEELNNTIAVEECYGVYYIFLKILNRLNIAKLYLQNTATILRRDVFDNALAGAITDIILTDSFDAVQFFGTYNKNFSLDVPQQLNEAASFAYSVCMDKYDELFAMAVPTAEGMSWVEMLKQRMEYSITAKMLSNAAQILTEGVTSDRRTKRGPLESRKFLADALADVNQRIQSIYADANSRTVGATICNYSISKQFDANNNLSVRDLYYMGITPIDDLVPVRTQDIITVIADEGIGKTRWAVDQAYRAIMAGKNVLYICGETPEKKIKKYIESLHCFEQYGLQLQWSEVSDPTTIANKSLEEIEDISIKINAAISDFCENPNYGTMTYLQSAFYENFADTIRYYKDKDNIDLVIVDHVLALRSDGTYTTQGRLTTKQLRVSYLYENEDILVKECDIAFINTSHPSVQTSADLRADRTPGARAGAESSDSTKYSSMVFILNNNLELRKQDLVKLYVTKLRDIPNIYDTIILKRLGYSNKHVFDPSLQYIGTNGTKQNADNLDALFEDEDDDEEDEDE